MTEFLLRRDYILWVSVVKDAVQSGASQQGQQQNFVQDTSSLYCDLLHCRTLNTLLSFSLLNVYDILHDITLTTKGLTKPPRVAEIDPPWLGSSNVAKALFSKLRDTP